MGKHEQDARGHRWRGRATGCTLAITGLVAVVSAGSMTGASTGGGVPIDADGDGYVVERIGRDAFVEYPVGEDLAVVDQPAGVGYAVLPGVSGFGLGAYTVQLVDSPGIEQIRPYAEAAATQISRVTGVQVSVAPGTTPERDALPGDVMVRVASSSSCGRLSVPGVAGCGGPRTLNGAIVTGQVWLAPQIPCDSVALSVVAHELGHAFGLGHYNDQVDGLLQLMYPSTLSNAPAFRAGDVAGLQAVAGGAAVQAPAAEVTAGEVNAVGGTEFVGAPAADPAARPLADPPVLSDPIVQQVTTGGLFSQPTVQRVLDTRSDPPAPFLPGQVRTFSLTPYVGTAPVDAVVLNVTTTRAQGSGYATVYPSDAAVPDTSSVNYVAGQDSANLVVVKVGPNNSVSIVAAESPVDLIADLFGVFSANGNYAFVASDPVRIADTRESAVPGERGFPLGCGDWQPVDQARLVAAGMPVDRAAAAVVNLTAVAPNAAGFVSLLEPFDFPRAGVDPTTSNLNVAARDTRANLAVTPGSTWLTQVSNSMAGDVVADLAGWFVPPATAPSAARLLPTTPTRILDTRRDLGLSGRFEPGASRTLSVPLPGGLTASQVTAVVVNVTVTDAAAGGYATLSPSGVARPTASNVNYDPGETVPNLAIVKLGANGAIELYTYDGRPHVIADVMGYFVTG